MRDGALAHLNFIASLSSKCPRSDLISECQAIPLWWSGAMIEYCPPVATEQRDADENYKNKASARSYSSQNHMLSVL